MFKERSKALFACAIIATIYTIYLVCYFSSSMLTDSTSEAIGGALATALVTPHMVAIGLGAVFSWIGFIIKKSWAALVGAILYCVGALLFILYAAFCIPLIILGFVGFSNQKKLSSK